MTWKINWSDQARKQLRKMNQKQQTDIIKYLDNRILTANHPRDFGKPLRYDKYGLWRYRVRDVRIICQIRDEELLILVLRIGHRQDVYQ